MKPTEGNIEEPIFIIGAARSGTTLLGEILSTHPEVAYWVEPKYIWRYGGARADSDVRQPDEATPRVCRYIRRKFAEFLEESGKSRFLEKTPSNCFRVEFMRKVFPNGKFIFLYRDGRDVARSAMKKWTSPPERSALVRRLRSMEIPMRDLPYYATDFFRDVIARQFHAQGAYIWGPFFPGIRETRATHTLAETCAIQWRESVRAMLEAEATVPEDQIIKVHYEDLVAEPGVTLNKIIDFGELPREEEVVSNLEKRIREHPLKSWRDYNDAGFLREVEKHIAHELKALQYSPEYATDE